MRTARTDLRSARTSENRPSTTTIDGKVLRSLDLAVFSHSLDGGVAEHGRWSAGRFFQGESIIYGSLQSSRIQGRRRHVTPTEIPTKSRRSLSLAPSDYPEGGLVVSMCLAGARSLGGTRDLTAAVLKHCSAVHVLYVSMTEINDAILPCTTQRPCGRYARILNYISERVSPVVISQLAAHRAIGTVVPVSYAVCTYLTSLYNVFTCCPSSHTSRSASVTRHGWSVIDEFCRYSPFNGTRETRPREVTEVLDRNSDQWKCPCPSTLWLQLQLPTHRSQRTIRKTLPKETQRSKQYDT